MFSFSVTQEHASSLEMDSLHTVQTYGFVDARLFTLVITQCLHDRTEAVVCLAFLTWCGFYVQMHCIVVPVFIFIFNIELFLFLFVENYRTIMFCALLFL